MTNLTHLDLSGTRATEASLEAIKAALPRCQIVFDFTHRPPWSQVSTKNPPYHRIPKIVRPRQTQVTGNASSGKDITDTLEFRLAFPLYEANRNVWPGSSEYMVLQFYMDRQREKKRPDYESLLNRARSIPNVYLKAKGIGLVGRETAMQGEYKLAVELADEALGLAKGLTPDSVEFEDILLSVSHLLAQAGELDRALELRRVEGSLDRCNAWSAFAAAAAHTVDFDRVLKLFDRAEEEAANLSLDQRQRFFARLARQRASVGDLEGAERSLQRIAQLKTDWAQRARGEVARHRSQAKHAVNPRKLQAPVHPSDEKWREKALQVAHESPQRRLFRSYSEYEKSSAFPNNTINPRMYVGTRVSIAVKEQPQLAERIALTLINRDYLPDDRLEDFRPFFDTPSQNCWLTGWSGIIHEIKVHQQPSIWTVRVSFGPYVLIQDGHVVHTYRRYLETWRYDASNEQMEFLGGQGLGGMMTFH